MSLRTVPVALDDRSYDVLIGDGALAKASERFPEFAKRDRLIVVTEPEIARLHGRAILEPIEQRGIQPVVMEVPGGERGKSWTGLAGLTDRLLAENIERGETIIALGGGVIGDLAGFAAAIVKRGVDFIQIPTTLLSQVDSSVGGKTAINTAAGKNMVGAFHQPRLVIADSVFLNTLPERELKAGYAEIAKAALIGDAPMFGRLEAAGAGALSGDTLSQAIADAVAFKARIVAEDEREGGVRALLNLGHTFGHAFEAEAAPGALVHGEAVAAGMALAFDFSVSLGVCPAEDADRVRAHLRAVGLPDGPSALPGGPYEAGRLVERMRSDKKNAGGRITLILARGVGETYIDRDVDEDVLVRFMEHALK